MNLLHTDQGLRDVRPLGFDVRVINLKQNKITIYLAHKTSVYVVSGDVGPLGLDICGNMLVIVLNDYDCKSI